MWNRGISGRMSTRQRPRTQKHSQNNSRMNARQSEDIIEHKPARRLFRGSTTFRQRLRKGMIFTSFLWILYLVYLWTNGGDAARLAWQKEPLWHESWYVIIWGDRLILVLLIVTTQCGNTHRIQKVPSVRTNWHLGPLSIPFQRPIEECRTFKSEHVEKLIAEVTKKMADKDLARLFENCFPNTLDTTVRWHLPDLNYPQSFIITGDM